MRLRHQRRGDADHRGRAARVQAGVVGGLEVLPFGLLIFVVGALIVANAWAVFDAKMAATSAAREAARVYVEAPSAARGSAAADQAARDAMTNYGRDPHNLDLSISGSPSFERCDRVTIRVRTQVAAISLPFGMGFGHGITVRAVHSEIIDPLRNGLGSVNSCGY